MTTTRHHVQDAVVGALQATPTKPHGLVWKIPGLTKAGSDYAVRYGCWLAGADPHPPLARGAVWPVRLLIQTRVIAELRAAHIQILEDRLP